MSDSEGTTSSASSPIKITDICCIGAGYVGGSTMAVMAKHCPNINVTVVDINRRRIDQWKSEHLPIYEPGLYEVVKEARGRNLFFSTNIAEAIKKAQVIFMSVNTPHKKFGALGGYDLSAYEAVARSIAKHLEGQTIVVEKSTVPVRTAERVRQIIHFNKKDDSPVQVLSNPEFLAEGTAVRDLEHPDRILIGSLSSPEGKAAAAALSGVYCNWVAEEKIIKTGLFSSEMSKLAANAFLAQRVSSINSLSALCEKVGADIYEVSHVVGADHRIGGKFLKASVGFGGSCFEKDLRGLIYLCDYYGLPDVGEYWRQVIKINDWQKRRFSILIQTKMFNNLKNKNVCILGFAFKKDTGDYRASAAISIVKFLVEEGANVFVYDPKVPHVEINKLFPNVTCCSDPYTASHETHALVVCTEWDEFKTLDYKRIFDTMEKPSFVFDGRNLLDHDALVEMGYRVYCIGKTILQDELARNW